MTTERDFTTADLANAGEASPPADNGHQEASPLESEEAGSQGEVSGAPTGTAGDTVAPSDAPGGSVPTATTDAAAAPLFPAEEAGQFREQWVSVQGQFVDEPRRAVEQADHLVAELMQRLAAQFSNTRSELERRWDGQENVSTEELRIAMTQYRSFFERLLQA